jgi:hypothetical protein
MTARNEYGPFPSGASGQVDPKPGQGEKGRRGCVGLFVVPGNTFKEVCVMPLPIKFESEVKTVPFGGGTIRIENLTPVLSSKDREKRKREVETRLYEVFSKYRDKIQSSAV